MRYVLDHEGKMYRKYFEDIASIPHESFNEKQLSDYIVDLPRSEISGAIRTRCITLL